MMTALSPGRGVLACQVDTMTISRVRFDPVAAVIDWLDACRGRRLNELLELYDETATAECAVTGETYRGRRQIEKYCRSRLAKAPPQAFAIDDLAPDGEAVVLDCQGHEGKPVRIRFLFNESGKILHTSCCPIGAGCSLP
jgi:hypothetical protein